MTLLQGQHQTASGLASGPRNPTKSTAQKPQMDVAKAPVRWGGRSGAGRAASDPAGMNSRSNARGVFP